MDACISQGVEPNMEKFASEPAATVPFGNDKMVNQAAPTVVTAQDGADEGTALEGNEAEAGVSSQEWLQCAWLVGCAKADAL